jgi:hypothetical protein
MLMEVIVVARSKASTVFYHTDTGVLNSTPVGGMDSLYMSAFFCVCILCRQSPCEGLSFRFIVPTNCL